jgi:cell division protein ZapA
MSDATDTTQEMDLTVANKTFRVKIPPDQVTTLQEAAKMAEKKMHAIAVDKKIVDSRQIAIMACVNLAFELITANKARETYFNHLNAKIKTLAEKIDTHLGPSTRPQQEDIPTD